MSDNFHDDIALTAGDDWLIEGTLKDEDGQPLDVAGAAFTWRLLDANGNPAAVNATITTIEPAADGKITINVPYAQTAGLMPGPYIDMLRADLVVGGRVTLSTGRLLVSADLFEAAA